MHLFLLWFAIGVAGYWLLKAMIALDEVTRQVPVKHRRDTTFRVKNLCTMLYCGSMGPIAFFVGFVMLFFGVLRHLCNGERFKKIMNKRIF